MLIELENVEKTYGAGDARVHALRGVSLNIEREDFVAVWGPSGSGKTSLLTTIAGLNRPSKGSVVVDGISIYDDLSVDSRAQFRNEYVGFIFQAFHLIPYLTALENVLLPLAPQSISIKEKKARAMEALESVNISEKSDTLPGELSGGQCQRTAIARAIINEPLIVLADEPTGNLDTDTRDDILALFESIRQKGHTLIMVTHDPDNIAFARNRIHIKDGLLM